MRDAPIHQLQRDVLRAVGKQMQLDVGVSGGGAGEHRSDQPRLELLQPVHGVQRCAPLLLQALLMTAGVEQTLIFGQRIFDFGIARQRAAVGDAEALGCLALGGQEVMNTVLRHDARRLLCERAAQVAVAG